MSIIFSTCFYVLNSKSKFSAETYIEWMSNFLSMVDHFYLVIYTDEHTSKYIYPLLTTTANVNIPKPENIKIIIKPMTTFYNYRYKEYWKSNHERNYLLNEKSGWELNMIWSEKVWFVKETADNKYFYDVITPPSPPYYGWCDIGYFRNRKNDTPINKLSNWANREKITKIFEMDLSQSPLSLENIKLESKKEKEYNVYRFIILIQYILQTISKFITFFLFPSKKYTTKIAYACISNDNQYMNYLYAIINQKNMLGLPIQEIPANQQSIAGGFFLIHKERIDWWAKTYDDKLRLYLENGRLVKDDQIILADCILSEKNKTDFQLYKENKPMLDNWFMFQRILG